MAKEIMTEDGRIFKQTQEGFVERSSNGYYDKPMSREQFNKETEYVKKLDLKEVARDNPRFAEMMWDKANRK